ncbi:MAG TPA: hypothetical protein PKW95_02205 [bacterium]|nr:hypothetical protein [bacterium]
MKRFMLILLLILLPAMVAMWACDDDDDDDNNDDGGDGGGVCYYECSYFTNTTIWETFCYGTGGTGDMATEALTSASACEEYAREDCEARGHDFEQYYFDTTCVSCDDGNCEPEWLSEY